MSPSTTTRSGHPINLPQGHLPASLRACPVAKPCPCALSPSQVLPDYLKGLFTVLPPARPGEQHFPHVAKLAALQHRAKDRHLLPTAYGRARGTWRGGNTCPVGLGTRWAALALTSGSPHRREMQDYVPPQLFRLLKPQSWLQMVTQHVQQAQALSAHQARAQFLGEGTATGRGCNADEDIVLMRM